MKVKVGDKVKVLAGKDKGKEGRVLVTLKKKDRVVVEGINIVKKHLKPGRTNETGGILETENPIHVSNVKVVTEEKKAKTTKPKKDKPTGTIRGPYKKRKAEVIETETLDPVKQQKWDMLFGSDDDFDLLE